MKLSDTEKAALREEFNKTDINFAIETNTGVSSQNTDWWLTKFDSILEKKEKDIVEMIEKGVETQETTSCPDNMPGCLVYHFKTVRRDLTSKELINKLNNND